MLNSQTPSASEALPSHPLHILGWPSDPPPLPSRQHWKRPRNERARFQSKGATLFHTGVLLDKSMRPFWLGLCR